MSIQPQKFFPEQLTPHDLDHYLARGWFRMRNFLYTTHFLHQHANFYNTIWLRIELQHYAPVPAQQKLLRKIDSRFRVVIEPFVHEPAVEDLYLRYCEAMPFLRADSIEALLGPMHYQIFDTHIVKMYDGEKLVAAGLFDIGLHAAAGIGSIYHPDYKKYSLGKALVLYKMNYCRRKGLQYFYPGYNVLGHPRFRYKLDICPPATYYYDILKRNWLPYHAFDERSGPLAEMQHQLHTVQKLMVGHGMHTTIRHYPLFDAGIWFHFKESLLQYPVYLCVGNPDTDDSFIAITFDIALSTWALWRCSHRYTLEMNDDVPEQEKFDTRLFEADHLLDVSDSAVFARLSKLIQGGGGDVQLN